MNDAQWDNIQAKSDTSFKSVALNERHIQLMFVALESVQRRSFWQVDNITYDEIDSLISDTYDRLSS